MSRVRVPLPAPFTTAETQPAIETPCNCDISGRIDDFRLPVTGRSNNFEHEQRGDPMALFNREDENPDVSSPSSKRPADRRSGRPRVVGGAPTSGRESRSKVRSRRMSRWSWTVKSRAILDTAKRESGRWFQGRHRGRHRRALGAGGRSKVVGNVRGIDRFEMLKSGRIEGPRRGLSASRHRRRGFLQR